MGTRPNTVILRKIARSAIGARRGWRVCAAALAALFFLLVLWLPAPATAQVAPAPDAPPTANLSQTPETGANPPREIPPSPTTLRVTSNLVDLFFVARDSHHHHLITDLTKSDCKISEDHVPQKLATFALRSNLPLTIGLLLDTGISQQNVLAIEKQAGIAFLRQILRPKDEAFLLTFDVNVDQLAQPTGDFHALEQAIAHAGINSNSENFANGAIPSIGALKNALLYDAVYLASNDVLHGMAGRKALVLLTNGQDEGSRESLHNAMESAQKADAVVYVLLISDPGPYAMTDFSDTDPVRKLAKETGGRVFEIGHNGRKLQAAFAEIEAALRSEYQVTYVPSNPARDGRYRRIQVQCSQNGKSQHVHARAGYYALPPVSGHQ